jgi:lysophospholipase L1-like esterase
MNKSIFLLTSILLLHFCINAQNTNAINYANLSKYADANASLTKSPEVIFLGNSITEGWVKIMPEFFSNNNFVGRGIGGQTSSQLLLRFRNDVINLKPKKLIINIGTNDIAENSGTFNQDFTIGNIESMIELAKQHKIKPIIASVLPAVQFPWRKEIMDVANKIIMLNEGLKALAKKHKIVYLDYHTMLKNENNGLSKEMAEDGVHPKKKCFELMANAAIQAIKK